MQVIENQTGIVESFDTAKGYGFIVKADGSRVFAHYRATGTLTKGSRITFTEIRTARGSTATNNALEIHALNPPREVPIQLKT